MKNRIKYFLRKPLQLFVVMILKLPFFKFITDTTDYQNVINFEFWFIQKVLGFGGNKQAYWPVHWASQVYNPEKIMIGVDSYPGIMKGCYIQGKGGIEIGDYTQIAPNVAIISANHEVYDLRKYTLGKVIIGNYCWIGAGAKIMPGVILGDFTIVAAGAVVTKSFENGYEIIGGIPAKSIKNLKRENCIQYEYPIKYYGYLNEAQFNRKNTK